MASFSLQDGRIQADFVKEFTFPKNQTFVATDVLFHLLRKSESHYFFTEILTYDVCEKHFHGLYPIVCAKLWILRAEHLIDSSLHLKYPLSTLLDHFSLIYATFKQRILSAESPVGSASIIFMCLLTSLFILSMMLLHGIGSKRKGSQNIHRPHRSSKILTASPTLTPS